jgi:hypothetical protein
MVGGVAAPAAHRARGLAVVSVVVCSSISAFTTAPTGTTSAVSHLHHSKLLTAASAPYVLSDRIWVLAHSTSSLTVSMVCSGTGGTACLTLARPRRASTAATAP